ncbi:anti-sigma factor [Cryobacterium ruanii]|uniref:Anti-sigma factor n=1 Tax=Cryobacterium ruanii TaxID=1259197 RepID=A0A4R9AM24_9MICO|nr:anti-sigma factor [Cryobacterium ruanii]TFD65422.1 anti-sigma factor [Cryobacterium ruanii]
MATDDELIDRLRRALADGLRPEPRPADIARVRAIAAAHMAEMTSSGADAVHEAKTARAVTPLRSRRILQVVAVATSLGVGFAIGAQVQSTVIGDAASRAGVVEFNQSITAAGSGRVNVEGRLVGIGRIVNLSSSDLPILPKGEFYEVWFVGSGDTPESQNRISAGTFHPDTEGKTDVVLTAAVDPRLYPILVITAEPGDGDPRPSDTEILRGELDIID